MRRLIRILSILVVLSIAVVVAMVAVLSSLNFNDYKGVVAEQVKKATGRDLKIAGDMRLAISLTPALHVDGVTFANAPWGTRPEMLKLKRLEAEVALLPLLSSRIDVKRVILEGADLLLETDKNGGGNWELGGAAKVGGAPAGGEGASMLPVVRKVRLKDLSLTYRDGVTGKETHLKLASLDLGAASPADPLKVALKGDVNGSVVTAEGTIASVQQLASGGAIPLDLRAQALGVMMSAKGAVADPKALTGIALTLNVSGDSLAGTVDQARKLVPQLADLKVPDLGPFTAAVTVTGSMKQLSLDKIDAMVGRVGETELSAKGAIADALKPAGLNLDVAAKVKDPAGLAKALGVAVPALPPVDVKAHVADAAGGYAVSGLDLTLGKSDLHGSATAKLGGTRPSVTADLTANLLDLDELMPKGEAAPAKKPADGRLFPADPLPLDGLKVADASVKLKAAQVRTNGMTVGDLDLGLTLSGGRLAVRPLAATAFDGRISGEATVGADQAVAPVKLDVTVKGLDYGKLQQALGQKDIIATGRMDAHVAVSGAGASVRQIMAGLDGTVRVVTENGRIESNTLNWASADVLSALPLVDSKGDKDLRCAVADFAVVKGIANAKSLVAETGGLSVVGVGAVNLRDETLNLVFEPRAKKTSLLSATLVPVALRGTLASPEAKVNPTDVVTGVAGNVLSGAAAVATFGLSALAQSAFNRATNTDQTDYCLAALAGKTVTPSKGQAPAEKKPSGSTAPAQQQKKEGGIGGALDTLGKGIGGGLKGLLGQ